ncbi:MAG: c-type cytochrome [Chloroflexota bacterium]
MSSRALILGTVMAAAVGLAACGKATQEQIYQALGVTPTPTRSAEEIAQATAAIEATRAAIEQARATPGGASAVFLGDAAKGKTTFTMWCMACHGPGGAGGDLSGLPGYNPETFMALLRTGKTASGDDHGPGPYPAFQVPDNSVMDLGAYLKEGS